MTHNLEELNKHYDKSKSSYNIKGESHLEYYKNKYPENYRTLIKLNSQE